MYANLYIKYYLLSRPEWRLLLLLSPLPDFTPKTNFCEVIWGAYCTSKIKGFHYYCGLFLLTLLLEISTVLISMLKVRTFGGISFMTVAYNIAVWKTKTLPNNIIGSYQYCSFFHLWIFRNSKLAKRSLLATLTSMPSNPLRIAIVLVASWGGQFEWHIWPGAALI